MCLCLTCLRHLKCFYNLTNLQSNLLNGINKKFNFLKIPELSDFRIQFTVRLTS